MHRHVRGWQFVTNQFLLNIFFYKFSDAGVKIVAANRMRVLAPPYMVIMHFKIPATTVIRYCSPY